jgi:hypothetical protein
MAATTAPKRQPTHAPSGGRHLPKPYPWLLVGGALFLIAWVVWTFVFSASVPK